MQGILSLCNISKLSGEGIFVLLLSDFSAIFWNCSWNVVFCYFHFIIIKFSCFRSVVRIVFRHTQRQVITMCYECT